MSQCPIHAHKVRPELPPLTERIAKLPVDDRGYPVPYFVQWVDANNQAAQTNAPGARPEFRMMDGAKWALCYKKGLCWVCGQIRLYKATFVIGPMCAINRTSSECPSHHECAVWSVKACPFLVRPHMVRREGDELIEANKQNVPGIAIRRNPGVSLLWTSNSYGIFRAGNGYLFDVGQPIAVEWRKEGRLATRAEVLESIDSGMPELRKAADMQPTDKEGAHLELTRRYEEVISKLIPKT